MYVSISRVLFYIFSSFFFQGNVVIKVSGFMLFVVAFVFFCVLFFPRFSQFLLLFSSFCSPIFCYCSRPSVLPFFIYFSSLRSSIFVPLFWLSRDSSLSSSIFLIRYTSLTFSFLPSSSSFFLINLLLFPFFFAFLFIVVFFISFFVFISLVFLYFYFFLLLISLCTPLSSFSASLFFLIHPILLPFLLPSFLPSANASTIGSWTHEGAAKGRVIFTTSSLWPTRETLPAADDSQRYSA